MITSYKLFESLTKSFINPSSDGLIYLTDDVTYANAYAMGLKAMAHKGITNINNGVIFVIWLDDTTLHWGGDVWLWGYQEVVIEDLKLYKQSGELSKLLTYMFDIAGIEDPNKKVISDMIKDPVRCLLQRVDPSSWSDIQNNFSEHSEICVKEITWNQIIEIRVYESGELTDVIQGGKDIDLSSIEPEDDRYIFYHGSPLWLWKNKLTDINSPQEYKDPHQLQLELNNEKDSYCNRFR